MTNSVANPGSRRKEYLIGPSLPCYDLPAILASARRAVPDRSSQARRTGGRLTTIEIDGSRHALARRKEGQTDYFNKLYPGKLLPGGIQATHNAIRQAGSMRDYLALVRKHPDFDTVTVSATLDDGFCLSYRHRTG